MIRTLLLSLVLAASSAGSALADGALPNIAGSWAFKSWTYSQCEFSGIANFSATNEPGVYGCEITARQTCPAVTWVVRQSCTARQSAERITITSTIEEFLEGPVSDQYWPDNFVLSISGPDRMSGSLISHGVHPSEFTRTRGAVS